MCIRDRPGEDQSRGGAGLPVVVVEFVAVAVTLGDLQRAVAPVSYTHLCLYEAPLMLEQSNFSSVVCRELGIDAPAPELTEWEHMVEPVSYTHLCHH